MTPDEHFASLTDEQRDAAIAMQAASWLRDSSQQYLKDTDWYVSRKAEAGTEIPADVLALRQQARLDASS